MSAVASAYVDTLPRRAFRGLLRMKLALVDRRRYSSLALEHVSGIPLVVLPDVFNPALLRSGEFLASRVLRSCSAGLRVLDLGSGSGACGVAAAQRGCHVVASDINPSAVRCTRINALLNNVDIDVRQGDLFDPVAQDQFEVVLFNPPYYRGAPRDGLDRAWRSHDVPERFAAELAAHLAPDGYALVVLSSDGDMAGFLRALDANSLTHEVIDTHDFINEVMTIHKVTARAC